MAESWSFHFEGGHPEGRYRDGRVRFHDGPFDGWMERVEMRPGFHLYCVEGRSSHRYHLKPNGVMPRGSMVLGTMLGGAGRVTTEGAQEQSWREERRFFALTPETQIGYHIEPGRTWAIVGLVLSPEALSELAGDALPELAKETVAGRREPFSLMRPLAGPATAKLAADLFRPAGTAMAGLRRQARCVEFLADLLEALEGDRGPGDLSAREKVRIREARERLLADLRDPPGLHDLADSVGLSAKRLNEGFRALFGTTVFDYLRDARLDVARRKLEDERSVPLKQLAWQVGYSHPTNFINAYRRRFGVSPASYRRRRLSKG